MKHLKPEEDLLVQCLKIHLNPHDTTEQTLKNLLKGKIDWEYFVATTSRNRMVPMVWNALNNEAYRDVPKEVAFELQKISDEKESRIIHNLNTLNKLLKLFMENDVEMIPFKGPNLNRLYKSYTLRQSSDLDIIIHKKDIYKVINFLTANGYKSLDQPENNNLKQLLKKRHSYTVSDTEEISEIDVHWCLENSHESLGIRYPIEKLWKQYSIQPVFNFQIPILHPEALILSTCIHHGLRNGWGQLRFICDVHVMIEVYKHLDWKQVISSAKKLKIKRVLLTGISLTNRLFDQPIPVELEKAISGDKSIKKIEQILIYKRLFKKCTEDEIHNSNTRIRYLMRDSFYAKLVFLNRLLLLKVKPNTEDKKFIPLPSYLYFMYYLIKPFRLAKKYIPLRKNVSFNK